MGNANQLPGVRIPRNAIRVWQSNESQSTLSGVQLTASLRLALPASPSVVHPLDWPSPAVGWPRFKAGWVSDSERFGLGMG